MFSIITSFLLLEVSLITNLVTFEIGLLRCFNLLQISNKKFISVFPGCETHLLFDQSTIFIFVKMFIGGKVSTIKLGGKFPSINFIEMKYFGCFVGIGDTKTFGNMFWIKIS